jgi:translation initiation factor IF-2
MAAQEGISIRNYDVIYTLVDDVSKALKGMLAPTFIDIVEGRAEVREIFTTGKNSRVAGVYVSEGKVSRDASVRVLRNKDVVVESSVSSLRRFKDDVRDVTAGYECGVGIKDFNEYEKGDILEFFRTEEAG